MPKKAGGEMAVQRALAAAEAAVSAQDLRAALSVLLPIRFGATLKDTAAVLGRSPGWVSARRQGFIAGTLGGSRGSGGRRNEIMPVSMENEFMSQICTVYRQVKVQWLTGLSKGPKHYEEYRRLFVDHVQDALCAHAGRPVSKATAYNLMARVGASRFENYRADKWASHCVKGLLISRGS